MITAEVTFDDDTVEVGKDHWVWIYKDSSIAYKHGVKEPLGEFETLEQAIAFCLEQKS